MSDRLERAFRSLRDLEDGRHPGADETLARVLGDLAATRGRRARAGGARMWLLAAAILVVSTMAAARTGSLNRVLRALSLRERGTPSEIKPAPSVVPPAIAAPAPRPTLEAPEAPVVSPAPSAAPEGAPAPVVAPAPTAANVPGPAVVVAASPARARATGSADLQVRRPLAAPSAAASTLDAPAASASAAPQIGSDDATFARAHHLHFSGGDPSAALAAWDDYLRRFPDGRFVPEARYNRAIDLLKLGRSAEAREALRAFADGQYGDYRRDEARSILRSLSRP
jgi:hypothetical protein